MSINKNLKLKLKTKRQLIFHNVLKKWKMILSTAQLFRGRLNLDRTVIIFLKIVWSKEKPIFVRMKLGTYVRRWNIIKWLRWWRIQIWWWIWSNKMFSLYLIWYYFKLLDLFSVVLLLPSFHFLWARNLNWWLSRASDCKI